MLPESLNLASGILYRYSLSVFVFVTELGTVRFNGPPNLNESVEYQCTGEVKFKISIKESNKEVPLTNLHLQICKSSWSNKWCTGPDSKFIKKPCISDARNSNETSYCDVDIPTMCHVTSSSGSSRNWYHSVYVTRVVGFVNGEVYRTKEFPLSPQRSQFGCSDNSLLGVEIRGNRKTCN